MIRPMLIKPGNFGVEVAADARRGTFDAHNESLLAKHMPIDAVFIGDSITDMWAIDAYFRGTQGLLVNRGISGDVTQYVRKRFEADVVQLSPHLVVLMIGVNNFWDIDTWWDSSLVHTVQEIEEGIITDISAMVKDALTHNIKVALCSILPTNSNSTIRNTAIQRVNERLEHIAHELQHIVFIDYHRHFVAGDGLTLRADLADDGLHPHSAGYEIMASTLLSELRSAEVSIIQAR